MSEKLPAPTIKNLPALVQAIDENRAVVLRTQEEFKCYINQETPKQWVKEHPMNRNVRYVPIDKVEAMLDLFFQGNWKVEIKNVCQLAQSIMCVVRLHYQDPITGDWNYHDGVGAVPLKTDKGCSAADLSKIKNDAVATGAPAAKSFAIKDAADHLGKAFGRDLNRKDTIALEGIFSTKEEMALNAKQRLLDEQRAREERLKNENN